MKRLLLLLAMLAGFSLTAQDGPAPLTLPSDCPILIRVGDTEAITVVESDDIIRIRVQSVLRLFNDSPPKPFVMRTEWVWMGPSGPQTIVLEYEFPIANPTQEQRRRYAEKFRDMIIDAQTVFPVHNGNDNPGGGNAGGTGVWILPTPKVVQAPAAPIRWAA